MQIPRQQQKLLNILTNGLRRLPGATALYLFGSLITPYADDYADIDLQLITADLTLTQQYWPAMLETIHPMSFAWPIMPDNTAFSLLFQGVSPYHKLDIGINAVGDTTTESFGEPSARCLWQQEPSYIPQEHPILHAYLPMVGTISHQLFEHLIAGVRYVKARKRGHASTAWRFMRSQPEILLALHYEQLHGWMHITSALTTWQYKALDQELNPAIQQHLMSHFNWSTSQLMDQNFVWFLEQIVDLYQQKAIAYHEEPPKDLINRQVAFIRGELGI